MVSPNMFMVSKKRNHIILCARIFIRRLTPDHHESLMSSCFVKFLSLKSCCKFWHYTWLVDSGHTCKVKCFWINRISVLTYSVYAGLPLCFTEYAWNEVRRDPILATNQRQAAEARTHTSTQRSTWPMGQRWVPTYIVIAFQDVKCPLWLYSCMHLVHLHVWTYSLKVAERR